MPEISDCRVAHPFSVAALQIWCKNLLKFLTTRCYFKCQKMTMFDNKIQSSLIYRKQKKLKLDQNENHRHMIFGHLTEFTYRLKTN